jgi:hypothetical protein
MSDLTLGHLVEDANAEDGDAPWSPDAAPTIGDVIAARYGRRDILKGALGVSAMATLMATGALGLAGPARADAKGRFSFDEIEHGADENHHVAPGYSADVLIRWGDPVVAGAPPFDPMNQTADAQERQFGYNNDYIGYLGLPPGSNNPDHGLLCINHEYTSTEVMFPGLPPLDKDPELASITREMTDIELAAHGASVIEIRKQNGTWSVVKDSPYNRRISTRSTPMTLSGPAAGHARLQTTADPSGTRVIGTLNNCAGGMTPWGTYLTAEENFHQYFRGSRDGHAEERNYKRVGIPSKIYAWGRFHDRFDIGKEPNEANRFGWIVEIDPLDPASTPVKRTALGRFKHEGAETVLAADGRAVIYSGDDEQFEYVYKFVSADRFDPNDRKANMTLLDNGTLFVARFDDDGKGEWMPLIHGRGPLTAENGFASQADVLIEARRAADLLKATRMDRPEDVEPDPKSGRAWLMLTNNTKRKSDQVDKANPRPDNVFGHIIEMVATAGDHASTTFAWNVLVRCGDPSVAAVDAAWNSATSGSGWFAAPDNCAIDHKGRLWVATDQGSNWSKSGTADGVWALETEGELRGTGRMFFRVPVGAEMCGPCFAPDDKTLFVAVQHPATDGAKAFKGFERNSTFEDPATRWPDFKPDMPPRPSVVAITRKDGGVIGG